jgi:hypothetical protein
VPPEERRPPIAGDAKSLARRRQLEEWIASAERIRSDLIVQVDEARARLLEAESTASRPPSLPRHLGAIVSDAEQRLASERAQADDVVASLTAHAERKARSVLAAGGQPPVPTVVPRRP